ncbi:MAG: hypothetical protein IJD04_03860 [Desulfovibrionaceae bacterium]|nr:hypothetical protein [Desulfovibrionaceae bacterium]
MSDNYPVLFAPPIPGGNNGLVEFENTLHTTLSTKPAHLRALPAAISELSSLLTERRAELARSYWADPRLKSAYLWYFLPWNLVRLLPLLSAMPLALEENSRILDLGSGPLTFPIALWLARPDLRKLPLVFHCNDMQSNALSSGQELFQTLSANAASPCAWKICLHKGSLNEALRRSRGSRFKLISALNMLNELKPGHEGLRSMLNGLLASLRSNLAPDGQILLVEPGNRLGGRIVETVRACALEQQLHPALPCPHNGRCPALNPRWNSWCHFVQENPPVPAWLSELSLKARLPKKHIALSFLLLDAKKRKRPGKSNRVPGRIISNPITLPGESSPARYACTQAGLALALNAAALPSGSLPLLELSERRDPKSGALLARQAAEEV